MVIIVYNEKGGVGKTMIATQFALHFDATIIEMDPYGVLTQTLNDDIVYKVPLNEKAPVIKDGDAIFDFGGFDDARLDDVASFADLIIIPFNPTINALGTTLKSYIRASKLNLPILFVVNATLNDNDANDAIDYLKENIQDEFEVFVIPHTRALQTAENEGVSVIELSQQGGLKKHTYKKVGQIFTELMNKISEYK
ncbi:MAG: ParA family protein [Campylobacterota bacterium]|nr:ParA family protein [Campylobacterota bacterium]